MPTTCQLQGKPSQEWTASHTQYAGGANSGFVASPSGPVAMGYWDRGQLPFTYDLATQFPIGDRWFCSLLGQTDPNRRFLIAATSSGMTDDIPSPTQDATLGLIPSNGTIFTQLTSHGISWAEYTVQYPSVTSETANLYPGDDYAIEPGHERPFSQFLTDAATGTLPSFSLVGPNFSTQSQEDPQNIALGEAFIAQVVMALGGSPKWSSTLLIIVYDEHGGYYDHVPPPVALAPDALPPVVSPGQSAYEGFKRYGFRVPAIVVGPYAKPGHVSHVVYDHTSILAFVERKWNLPALTLRDANANDLTDFLDLAAMRAGVPTFPELPALAAPGDTAAALACSASGPGVVPPARPAPLPIEVRLTGAHTRRARHEVVARVQASRTGLGAVTVALEHRGKRVAHRTVAGLTSVPREVVLRVGHGVLHPGHYAIVVTAGHRTLAHRALRVG
jgi:phospholipase C